MNMSLALVTLLVRDYDEAIAYFCDALRFELVEDTVRSPVKRWVVVRPPGDAFTGLLLAKAEDPEQSAAVGRQAGGRVAFFLRTNDFEAQVDHMRLNAVHFEEAPRHEPYGSVVVFRDLYGNRWDLLGPAISSEKES